MSEHSRAVLAALEGRLDLEEYGSNRLMLFALELKYDLEDVRTIAADALTDGPDDKKCDLVYVDRERELAVVAQSDLSNKGTGTAPANKASDLNTAASWLLGHSPNLPDTLKAAARDLREAIESGSITKLEFWFVHNLQSSENVRKELAKVEGTADALLKSSFPKIQLAAVSAQEIDLETIADWYRASQAPILVSESFEFQTTGGFTVAGENWEAYSTLVPARWLSEMYNAHGTKLFAANVRDYLGSRRSDQNINHNIKDTAKNSPRQFWAFNNGITALVNDFSFASDDNDGLLQIDGIAIVNGAQTTGALGNVGPSSLEGAVVQARFIKCKDAATVQQIIRFNNSQNKIEAADYRSNDPIQQRLREEFVELQPIQYRGGRRGGEDDKIKRPPNLIPSETAGQALAAFHGQPAVAYNKKSEIWKSDLLYSRVFSEETTGKHIVFVYSLLRAIEWKKHELSSASSLTEFQKQQLMFLRGRGSIFLLMAAIAESLEILLQRPIPNRRRLNFGTDGDLTRSIGNWTDVLPRLLPFASQLSPALVAGNLKSNSDVFADAVGTFKSLVVAAGDSNRDADKLFAGRVLED